MVVREREVLQEESGKERAQAQGRAVGRRSRVTDAVTTDSTQQNSRSQRREQQWLRQHHGHQPSDQRGQPARRDPGPARRDPGPARLLHQDCNTLTKWPGLHNTSEEALAGI